MDAGLSPYPNACIMSAAAFERLDRMLADACADRARGPAPSPSRTAATSRAVVGSETAFLLNMTAHAFKQEQTNTIALELQGETMQDLFAEAVRALAELIGKPTVDPPGPWVHELADAVDQKHLLVAWINDVLERIEVDRILYSEAEIDELTDTQIRARLRGSPMAEKKTAVLEATVHGLIITTRPDGCSATVNLLLQT